MSEIKRYACKVNKENDFDLTEHPNGEFVRYEDYEKLKNIYITLKKEYLWLEQSTQQNDQEKY
jgi:hypothetical protein